MSVYERAEALLRDLLGKRRNAARCLLLGMWLLRTHGNKSFRRFSVPRKTAKGECGLQNARNAPELTEGEIRGAVKALEEVGFLVRTTQRFKRFRSPIDLPTLYVFGMEFASLFPGSSAEGAQSSIHNNEGTQVLENRAPLFVVTKDRPFGRPVRPRVPKTERDLHLARAEAAAQDLPPLSPTALRAGRLYQYPAFRMQPETAGSKARGGDASGPYPGRSVRPSTMR